MEVAWEREHHDVDGLRHVIVKEPQVLFNKVTDLIIRTISCKALLGNEQRDFQKRILFSRWLLGVIIKSLVNSF